MLDDETKIYTVGPRLGLFPRQLEVLALCAAGLSYRDIGAILHVKPETVRRHLYVINRRLGVKSRVQAALCYYRALVGP